MKFGFLIIWKSLIWNFLFPTG